MMSTIDDYFDFFEINLENYATCSKLKNKIEILFKNNIISIDFDRKFVEFCNEFNVNENRVFFKIVNTQYIKNFYIYTDIISDVLIFNKSEPILKILKPQGHIKEYVENYYDRPQYIHVNKTYINKIQIKIVDQNQELVEFTKGQIILKLHFRKSKK